MKRKKRKVRELPATELSTLTFLGKKISKGRYTCRLMTVGTVWDLSQGSVLETPSAKGKQRKNVFGAT